MTRKIPAEQCAIAGANIRALRQRNGWTQATLGRLMGWPATATVCAAEGHRLAAIFGISPSQLTTRCANCHVQPPAGFACLACGATPGNHHPATSALPRQAPPGHTAVSR